MDQANKILQGVGAQKKLFRSVNDRWLYGVIGGIAKYTSIDSNLLRIIAIVIGHGGGTGIIVYMLLALYLPEDPNETKNPAKSHHFSFGKLLLLLIAIPIGLVLFFFIALVVFGWLFGVKG